MDVDRRLEAVYGEAVEDVFEYEPPASRPSVASFDPDAHAALPGHRISSYDAETNTLWVNEETVVEKDRDELRTILHTSLLGAYEQTVMDAVAAHHDDLTEQYTTFGPGTGYRPIVRLDDTDPHRVTSLKPGSNLLRVGSGFLDAIDLETGTLADDLDHLLRQRVAHHLLDGEVFPSTVAWLDTRHRVYDPEPLKNGYDAHILYHEAADTVAAEEGADPATIPEIRFDAVDGFEIESGGGIVFDERVLDELHRDLYWDDMQRLIAHAQDTALRDTFDPVIAHVQDAYRDHDPELTLDAVRFDDIDTGVADHHHGERRIRFDAATYRGGFDPGSGGFRDPYGRFARIHEAVHALHFQHNPAVQQFRDALPEDEALAYTEDVRNAAFEAITTFEEYVAGYRGRMEPLRAMDDPWTLPTFFRGYLDMEDRRPDGSTIRDPYNLGLYTALSVYDAARTEHGRTEALDWTRTFLLESVLSLDGMRAVIERSTATRDVPNYPAMLRDRYETFQDAETLDAAAGKMARTGLVTFQEPDIVDPLDWYLEARAIREAYEASGGRIQDAPWSMLRLDERADAVRDRHGSVYRRETA